MAKQIAVRLPDDVVAFIDEVVGEGRAASRAAVVAKALERERRRDIAARDAAILAEAGAAPDLDALARFSARVPLDID